MDRNTPHQNKEQLNDVFIPFTTVSILIDALLDLTEEKELEGRYRSLMQYEIMIRKYPEITIIVQKASPSLLTKPQGR